MTLIPTMKTRLASPSDVVDLAHIAELKGIKVSGDTVTIGAATTHAEVATDAALKKALPASAISPAHIGDPHVRHSGTIGGSIANNDPAADYPAAMLALDATIVTDKREIAAERFLQRPVRDGAGGRRDGDGGALHRARQGRLREIPQPGLALRDDRRVRGQDAGRRARRGHRRRRRAACSASKEIEAALARQFRRRPRSTASRCRPTI